MHSELVIVKKTVRNLVYEATSTKKEMYFWKIEKGQKLEFWGNNLGKTKNWILLCNFPLVLSPALWGLSLPFFVEIRGRTAL